MRLLIRFKRLYAVIVTYPYALNIFKPIYTYYLLNVLIYSILSNYCYDILISLYRSLVGFVGTLLLLVLISLPCFLSLLNWKTFVFHSLKSINIFNLCRLCPHFGLV